MNTQSQEDSAFQGAASDSNVGEDNLPTNGLHGFMMRHMGHQDDRHSNKRRTKSIPIVPVLLLIMVALHITVAIFLAKTGSTGFSLNNPMTYGMIGLLVVFGITKLRLIAGVLRGRGKQPPQEALGGSKNIQNE